MTQKVLCNAADMESIQATDLSKLFLSSALVFMFFGSVCQETKVYLLVALSSLTTYKARVSDGVCILYQGRTRVEGSTLVMAAVSIAAITREPRYIVDSTTITLQLRIGVATIIVVALGAAITTPGNQAGYSISPTGSKGAQLSSCTRSRAMPCTTIWTITSG
jgi:hypothetical protein